MPPKVARRPAARVGAAKAAAKAAGLRRPALRRPAGREEEPAADPAEAWRGGREVEAREVLVNQLASGSKVVITRGMYWEQVVKVAGVVKGLHMTGGGVSLDLEARGTDCEALVKWRGANPGKLLEVHLCPQDCPQLLRDGLVHATRLQKWAEGGDEGWMSNLMEAREPGSGEPDELATLRERSRQLGEMPHPRGVAPPQPEAGKCSSGSSGEEARKKAKKKKKKKKEKIKVQGTKRRMTTSNMKM